MSVRDRKASWVTLLLVSSIVVPPGCGDDSGGGADTDAPAEAEAEAGADGDADVPSEAETGADADADAPTEAEAEAGADADADTAEEADVLPDDGGVRWEGIACGFGVCAAGTQACCVTVSPPGEECTTPDGCGGGLAVTCDGPEDCGADEACCLPTGGVARTRCWSPVCPLTGTTACHEDADCTLFEEPHCCPSVMLGWAHKRCAADPCP